MLLEDLLAELGCVVVGPVATVAQAMASLESEAVDVAMLDVNLHGQRSYPVAEWLVARGRPFLFVTGYGQRGLDPAYHAQPVLQKPFTRDDLAAALGQSLDVPLTGTVG